MQKISISNREYNYKIRYSKRAKYLKLQINEQGLELILPFGVSLNEGEKFIFRNREWIQKHFARYEKREPADFFYLGRRIRIEHRVSLNEKHIRVEMLNDNELLVTSAPGRTVPFEKVYDLWLRNQAKYIIPKRVSYLAEIHGFTTGRVSIRNQKTRWGSCAHNGNLSFNSKLMMFDPEILDYVIIHELCHLREMNHSAKFWKNVEAIIPHYKDLKSKLKKNIIK